MGPALTISIARREGVAVAALVGEVDMANAEAVADELTRRTGDERALVVDLGDVAYLDSSGLRVLDGLVRDCQDRGAIVRIVAPATSAAGAALRMIGFVAPLLAEDVDEAFSALSS